MNIEDPSQSLGQQQNPQQQQLQNDNEFGDFMSTPAVKPTPNETTSNGTN